MALLASGSDASRFRKQGGSETRLSSAEIETERSVPHSLRRRRKIVAALKLYSS